jgi:phage terminase large subunit-like protein
MTALETIVMPTLHPAQHAVREHPARFKVLVTGRRFGKTFLGVAMAYETALRGGDVWWLAPSYPMTRAGWVLVLDLAAQIPGADVNRAERIVTVPGGGTIQVRSGHEPDSLRGAGLDLAVLDECAYMDSAVWTAAIRPALSDRKGGALFISSPRGDNWFAKLYDYARKRDDDQWTAFHYPSSANPFLDESEIESARDVLTARLFRQEYGGEILSDTPGALWTRKMIDQTRVFEYPPLTQIVVGVDPAVSSLLTSDETGIIVAGMHEPTKHAYVLADLSGRYTPDQWATKVKQAYETYKADRVVAETNNGGDLVERVLRTVDPFHKIAYRKVHASRNKKTRAQPISAHYEQERVSHVGTHRALEDQLVTWVPGKPSPDRLDALVWSLTAVMLSRRGGGNIR